MGLFSWRRRRESAIPESANAEALGSFARQDDQPVVGEPVGGGQHGAIDLQAMGVGDTLRMLGQLAPMIQQAIATGNVQISQGEPEVIDMRGSDLSREIREIMSRHGIDADGAATQRSIDASDYGSMQQQILEALSRHGVDAGASGTAIDFEISGDDDPRT